MNPRDILVRPLLTEKGARRLETQNQYSFEVAGWANKIQIKRAIESMFTVKVASVRVCVMPGKPARLGRFVGRHPAWKRATVTLKGSDRIPVFETI